MKWVWRATPRDRSSIYIQICGTKWVVFLKYWTITNEMFAPWNISTMFSHIVWSMVEKVKQIILIRTNPITIYKLNSLHLPRVLESGCIENKIIKFLQNSFDAKKWLNSDHILDDNFSSYYRKPFQKEHKIQLLTRICISTW